MKGKEQPGISRVGNSHSPASQLSSKIGRVIPHIWTDRLQAQNSNRTDVEFVEKIPQSPAFN